MQLTRSPFGTMPDGTLVEALTLAAANISVTVITLGASVQAVRVPARDGTVADIALGYDDLAGYLAQPNYFGATIGRYANRIARGAFTLDGTRHHIPCNDGANTLHGGPSGFDRKVWNITALHCTDTSAAVTLRHISPGGDQGFPGTLTATATYAMDEHGALAVTYTATTDAPTIVNLTNHTYWNLGGEHATTGALSALLTIPAADYLPVDAVQIPTGEFRPVANTVFDFREPRPIDLRLRDGTEPQLRPGRGYDHCWVIAPAPSAVPVLAARAHDPASGRVLELLTDAPGLQVYSGNSLDGSIAGKSARLYRQGDAFALEPQLFPDTPNQPALGSARLDPGQTYRNRIIYGFSLDTAATTKPITSLG